MKTDIKGIYENFHLFGEALDKANLDDAAYQLRLAEQKMRHIAPMNILWAYYYLNKASLYNNQGNFDGTIESCLNADRVIPHNKHFELKAKHESMQASAYKNMGNYHEATLHVDKAIQFYQRANKKENTAEELLTKGKILLRQGEWAEAIKHFSKVLEIARKNDFPKIEAKTYLNLGFVFRGHRFLYLAIDHFRDAEKIFRQQEFGYGVWHSMYERANTWLSLKEPEKTIELIKQMESLFEVDDPFYYFTWKLWYVIYNQKEEFNKALEYSFKLHQFFENAKAKVGIAESLVMMGSVYYNLRQMDKAIEYGEQAAKLAEEIGDKLIGELSNSLIRNAKNFY